MFQHKAAETLIYTSNIWNLLNLLLFYSLNGEMKIFWSKIVMKLVILALVVGGKKSMIFIFIFLSLTCYHSKCIWSIKYTRN